MRYRVISNLTLHTRKGWTSLRQVPTFYVDAASSSDALSIGLAVLASAARPGPTVMYSLSTCRDGGDEDGTDYAAMSDVIIPKV